MQTWRKRKPKPFPHKKIHLFTLSKIPFRGKIKNPPWERSLLLPRGEAPKKAAKKEEKWIKKTSNVESIFSSSSRGSAPIHHPFPAISHGTKIRGRKKPREGKKRKLECGEEGPEMLPLFRACFRCPGTRVECCFRATKSGHRIANCRVFNMSFGRHSWDWGPWVTGTFRVLCSAGEFVKRKHRGIEMQFLFIYSVFAFIFIRLRQYWINWERNIHFAYLMYFKFFRNIHSLYLRRSQKRPSCPILSNDKIILTPIVSSIVSPEFFPRNPSSVFFLPLFRFPLHRGWLMCPLISFFQRFYNCRFNHLFDWIIDVETRTPRPAQFRKVIDEFWTKKSEAISQASEICSFSESSSSISR